MGGMGRKPLGVKRCWPRAGRVGETASAELDVDGSMASDSWTSLLFARRPAMGTAGSRVGLVVGVVVAGRWTCMAEFKTQRGTCRSSVVAVTGKLTMADARCRQRR